MSIAIIGGTGLERLRAEYRCDSLVVETQFGPSSAVRARLGKTEVLFLSRHGESHALAPHEINYRANIAALQKLGVTRALATNAVGSLRLDLPPGSLVILDDFIDFTRSRPLTLHDSQVIHTDFSQPYCPALRAALIQAAARESIPVIPRGTYLCVDGPRFETPAEIRMFAQWGADVVGMTGLPEAVFAREAGICYAGVAIVTNAASGLTDVPVRHGDVTAAMEPLAATVEALLRAALPLIPGARACPCAARIR